LSILLWDKYADGTAHGIKDGVEVSWTGKIEGVSDGDEFYNAVGRQEGWDEVLGGGSGSYDGPNRIFLVTALGLHLVDMIHAIYSAGNYNKELDQMLGHQHEYHFGESIVGFDLISSQNKIGYQLTIHF